MEKIQELLRDTVGPEFEAEGIPGVKNIFTRGHRVADIRGWGYFQYQGKTEVESEDLQDEFSRFVARALTAQYTREFADSDKPVDISALMGPRDPKPWVLWDCVDDLSLRAGTASELTENLDEAEGYESPEAVAKAIENTFGHHVGDKFCPLRRETARAILRDVRDAQGGA
jgi:hypothetical protein